MGLIFNGNDANMQIKVKFNFVSKKLGMAWKMIIGRAIDVNKPKREQLRNAILQINLMFKSFLVNTPYFESKLSENIFVIEEYEYNALVNIFWKTERRISAVSNHLFRLRRNNFLRRL